MLERSEKMDPPHCKMITLRAEAYREMRQVDKARSLLEKAVAESPKELVLRESRFALEIMEGNWSEAERLYAELKADFGDSAVIRLIWVRYLIVRYGNEAGPRLRELEKGTEHFTAEEKKRLLAGLAVAAKEAGGSRICQDADGAGVARDTAECGGVANADRT